MIRVLIVDDHKLVRSGIRRLLTDSQEFEVVGEADNGERAIAEARKSKPDIILLDVRMPGMGGLEATRRLVRVVTKSKIIAVSAFSEPFFVIRILQAGAKGYLAKESSGDDLLRAIRKVQAGERYLSPKIAEAVALSSLSDEAEEDSPLDCLSERELQVMMMITSGLKVQEIADRLCLSAKTVNSYRYRLFEKLKIRNDVELTLLAVRHRLIEKPLSAETIEE